MRYTREAARLYRRLVDEQPDGFVSDLAHCLSNLGALLGEAGHGTAALEIAREAVELYRRLADERPDACLPHLAVAMGNLGCVLQSVERAVEAVDALAEGIRLLWPFYVGQPAAYDSWMQELRRDYRRAASAAGVEPDVELREDGFRE